VNGEAPWPRVTIVTPSFNQGEFLEETIRSVLLQGYPNLEYVIIDGGSSDESVDIIQKYDPWLAHWESKPDRGQSHAINKGFERATGEIVAWINSDDFYHPGAIRNAVLALRANPEASFVYSDCDVIDEASCVTGAIAVPQRSLAEMLTEGNCIAQPTVFMRRDALHQAGFVREDLHMVMDYELWLRLMRISPPVYMEGARFAAFRMHKDSKTVGSTVRQIPELRRVIAEIDADASLDRSLRSIKRRACGRVYFHTALHAVEGDRAFPDGITWYVRAALLNPRVALGRPLTPLWFLREAARQLVRHVAMLVHRRTSAST
jgi:glycosyltransferase involved in cell wall biosynthesis